jgi:hypothetical protein
VKRTFVAVSSLRGVTAKIFVRAMVQPQQARRYEGAHLPQIGGKLKIDGRGCHGSQPKIVPDDRKKQRKTVSCRMARLQKYTFAKMSSP